MASQKIAMPKLKLPKKLHLAHMSPMLPIHGGILADSKVSTIDKSDKTGETGSPKANQMNHNRDMSKTASESVVEVNIAPDFNGSELSIIKMLEDENFRHMQENSMERRLKEEIFCLRKDLATKSSIIERLIRENDALRKEMDELLTTVEDAKEKINLKLYECKQRIHELEKETKMLREENMHYQNQFQKVNKELKSTMRTREADSGKRSPEIQNRMSEFYQKVNNQVAELVSAKAKQQSLNSLIQSQFTETHQDFPSKMNNKIKSPTQKPRFSTPKVGNISSQGRNIRPANASPTNIGRTGAINNSNRKTKMLTLQINDGFAVNKSENNCMGGNFHPTDSSASRKSPKHTFTPKSKIRLAFHAEGFDFGDETN